MENHRGLVSVVIPTFNYGRYIREAVESVLTQTYRDIEVIVIDDGSTDDTQQVLASIRDARMRVVRTQNGGISAARNAGLDRCRGEYIAFLDADDRWKPTKLERQVRIMEAEPDVCAVFTNFERFNEEGFFPDDQFAYFPELEQTPRAPTQCGTGERVTANPFVAFLGFAEFPTWVQTTMFRATCVEGLRFVNAQAKDGRLLFAEDGLYCFLAFRRGGVAFTSDVLVEVRRHDANITKRTLDLVMRDVEIAKLKHEMLLRLGTEDLTRVERKAVRQRIGRSLVDLGRMYVKNGLHLQAMRAYLHAFRTGSRVQALRWLAALPLALVRPQTEEADPA